MNLRYLQIIAFLILPFTVQSQNCNIKLSGTIVDSDTKEVLPYATIINTNSKEILIASDKGCFVINGICPKDSITLVCRHTACHPKKFTFIVSTDSSIIIDMPHHQHTFDDIDFIMQHDDENTQAKSTLEGHSLDRQKGKSLGESLKNIIGVTTLETGNSISKPIIHGMHSQRVKIYNNDVQLENQSWGTEHAPEIDPYIANKVTVIKGAGSLRYTSNATGGIVLVEPIPLLTTPGIRGNAYIFGFSNGRAGSGSLEVEGNHKSIPWLSWRLQGSHKRGGNLKTPNYFMKNTGYKNTNYSGTIAISKEKFGIESYMSIYSSDLGIFSASHFGNLTDLQAAFEADRPLDSSGFSYFIDSPKQKIYHELSKLKTYYWLGEESKLTVQLSRQYNSRSEFDDHDNGNIPQSAFELTTHSSEVIMENHIHEIVSSTIGLNYKRQLNTTSGSSYFIPDFINDNWGAFVIERFDRKKTSFEVGLRYDKQNLKSWVPINNVLTTPKKQFGNLVYNIGGIYRFDHDFDVHFNFGSTWRAPTVNELYSDGLHHGAASIEEGNPDLKSEFAKEISMQFNYHKHEKFNAELTFYQKTINDYIYLNPTGQTKLTIRGAFPVFNYQQENSIFQGIDLGINYKPTNSISWNMRTSIVRAFTIKDQVSLPFIPSDRIYNGLRYTFKKNDKVKNAFIEIGMSNIAEQTRILSNSDFVPPPSSYTLFNVQSGISKNFGKQRIDFGIEVKNLFNTVYRDYMNRFRYFSDNIGRNIILNIKVPFNIKSNKNDEKS